MGMVTTQVPSCATVFQVMVHLQLCVSIASPRSWLSQMKPRVVPVMERDPGIITNGVTFPHVAGEVPPLLTQGSARSLPHNGISQGPFSSL